MFVFYFKFPAKLHALLNNNIQVAHSTKQMSVPIWEPTDESLSEDSR